MPPRFPDVVRVLVSHGFVWVGGRGSHRVYQHQPTGETVVVPAHASDITPGALNAVRNALVRALGITKAEARRLI